MDGDVMLSGIPLPMLLAVAATAAGGLFAMLRWFAARLLSDIEQRLARIDAVDKRFDQLLADLPLNYQRRDDAIRELGMADERYQKAIERLIGALREEIADARRRIESLETSRDEAVMLFQRREDAIREFTAVNAKLDRIYEMLARRSQ